MIGSVNISNVFAAITFGEQNCHDVLRDGNMQVARTSRTEKKQVRDRTTNIKK